MREKYIAKFVIQKPTRSTSVSASVDRISGLA